VFELAAVPTIGIRAGFEGGALVVAGGVMTVRRVRSAVCRPARDHRMEALAVDRVSILPSVMRSTACVAGAREDSVCRRIKEPLAEKPSVCR